MLVILLCTVPVKVYANDGPESLLPDGAEGWVMSGPDGVYGPENLYDLIDGAAEVYLAFNVRTVVSRRYVSGEGADIIADVFDMGSPKDAFGAYRFDMREGEEVSIGTESEIVGSSLAFWKDRYFVSITPFDDNPAVRKAVLAIGETIAAAVPGDEFPPDLLGFLPAEGLVKSQVHYFHDNRILGLLVPVTGKNLLGLSRDTEGIIARYRPAAFPGTQPMLIVVRYPDEGEARGAEKAVHDEIASAMDERSGDSPRRWSVVRRKGDILVTVLRGAGREQSRALAEEVLSRIVAQEEGGR